MPPKRHKTVREPAGAPVSAVVPRAPRTVAAVREEVEDDEDDDEEGDVDEVVAPMPPEKLVAGGKKAKLAVELKLNLEIELELKAYIHGDVTLELFN